MQFDKAFLYFVDYRHFDPVADTVKDDTQTDNPSDRLCADIRVNQAVHAETCSQHTKAADNPPTAETDALEIKRTDREVDAFKPSTEPDGRP